ncbi:DUF3858 domain-containing protein [Chitinophaga rhizophila]|uniref:DUF3858 domain-containing protein n=1 Tax=Chitinophaga rhizophila TaxID=2866212 RepID=A0ABS7GGP5_9BACT|nr:DUF3858 domain-containing protein [Chitinophaga rhizophila]MBW8686861.1 DUF3858 domain-containing protein [Chitinophaga rhizophila]
MRISFTVAPLHLLVGCLISCTAFAQSKVKFGKITAEDFKATTFEKDTSAHAVVLADIGSSDYQADGGDLHLVFKKFKRVKIVDKNAYDEATVNVYLYHRGSVEEKLLNVRASAYNLVDGKVVETRMEGKSVFSEKMMKNYTEKKFTIPAVKEGTIIEYTYSINSPFESDLSGWKFQDEYPVLLSEYTVNIPEIYDFVFLKQDVNGLLKQKTEADRQTFNLSYALTPTSTAQHYSMDLNTARHVWTAENIPALKEESYTTSLSNHITKIDFQLSALKYPHTPVKPILSTWEKFAEEMYKRDNFGADLTNNNGFLGDVVDQLTDGLKDDTAKARRIYNYVRTNFTCTQHSGLLMTKTLKSVFSSHNGNETDLNLLLVAMLRRAKLQADPVILSTRDHGVTHELYPLVERFNYTIAALTVDTLTYFLDASLPYLGFGRLNASCYNGHARLLKGGGATPIPVYFNPDELVEQKSTYVMAMGTDGGGLKGTLQQIPTYFESCAMRSSLKDQDKETYFKRREKDFGPDASISKVEVENMDDNETPLTVKYDFELKPDESGMMYINPLFNEATLKNPFQSQERFYPVEMSHVIDESYTLNLSIPDGYTVEELPQSAVVKLNETEGVFQYLIQQSDNAIQFRSRIKLSRAVFAPSEYPELRSFFDMIVKKQSEQIVLKRKS